MLYLLSISSAQVFCITSGSQHLHRRHYYRRTIKGRCINLIALCFFLWATAQTLFAQQAKQATRTDSLKHALQSYIMTGPVSQRDTALIRLLTRYAEEIIYVNSDEALTHTRKANEMAHQITDYRGICDALHIQGIYHEVKGQFDSALTYNRRAETAARKINYIAGIAKTTRSTGVVYFYQGKYDDALEQYRSALQLDEQLASIDGQAKSLSNIGTIYGVQQQYDMALVYFKKALIFDEQTSDKRGISYTLNNIGNAYMLRKQYDSALPYFQRSRELRAEVGDKRGLGNSLNSIGTIYRETGNYAEAFSMYEKALALRVEAGDKRGIANVNNNIARLYQIQRHYDQAREYASKALFVARAISARPEMQIAYLTLADSHQSEGKTDSSYFYFRKHAALKDSLSVSENLDKYTKLRSQYDTEKQRRQIEVLEKEKFAQALELERQNAELLLQQAKAESGEQALILANTQRDVSRLQLLKQQADLEKSRQQERERTQQLALQALELERQTLSRNLLITGSFVLLLIVGGIAYRFRLKHQSEARLRETNIKLHEANEEIQRQMLIQDAQSREIELANALLQEKNEQLKHINLEKNEFLGIVAHDLKNPLTSISLTSETLWMNLQKAPILPQQKEKFGLQLQSIANQAERMTTIITQLLDVNRIETKGFQLFLQPINPQDIFHQAIADYHDSARAKGITLCTEIPPDLQAEPESAFVIADILLLTEICSNLLSNAVKYSPHHTTVTLRLRALTETVRIEIADQGQGLTEDDKHKLFGK